MALLIITTILWAFSFSLFGEYLAGHVDSYFAVLIRVGLAALVFLPFLRTRGHNLKTISLYMLVGAMQLGIMYMLSFHAYLYLTVSETAAVYRSDAALYHADLRCDESASFALGLCI